MKKNMLRFLSLFLGVLFILSGCKSNDEYQEPILTISQTEEMKFDIKGGVQNFTISTNRAWTIEIDPTADWLSAHPKMGNEVENQEIRIEVEENTGIARQATVTVKANILKKTFIVSQEGNAEEPEENLVTIKQLREMFKNAGDKDDFPINEDLILKAIVVSDVEGGNNVSKKNAYIFDATGGIAVRAFEDFKFKMGDELAIELKGGKLSKYNGVVQLGFSMNKVQVKAQGKEIVPVEVSMEDLLSATYEARLVRIKDVQFKAYKGVHFYIEKINESTGKPYTTYQHKLETCDGKYATLIVSKYAKFAKELVPAGKGIMQGICTKYVTKDGKVFGQIEPRNKEDYKEMSNDEGTRCEEGSSGTSESVTIKDLLKMFKDSGSESWTVDKNLILTAIVTSDLEGGNSTSKKNGYIQDATGGIAFRFSDNDNEYKMGDKVLFLLQGATVSLYNGSAQIGIPKTNTKLENSGNKVTPKEVTIEEVLKGEMNGFLIKITDVQFKEYKGKTFVMNGKDGKPAHTNHVLENCSDKKIDVFIAKYAKFGNEAIPAGKGNIAGILNFYKGKNDKVGKWQLMIRNKDDYEEMSNDEGTRCK